MEQESDNDPSDMTVPSSDTAAERGDDGGDNGAVDVKVTQSMMRCLSSPIVILFSGLRSKILQRMLFKSSDNGRIVFRKLESLRKAR